VDAPAIPARRLSPTSTIAMMPVTTTRRGRAALTLKRGEVSVPGGAAVVLAILKQ